MAGRPAGTVSVTVALVAGAPGSWAGIRTALSPKYTVTCWALPTGGLTVRVSGLPGVAYAATDPSLVWPPSLQPSAPPSIPVPTPR